MYIQEAHPIDLWQVSSNVRDGVLFASPATAAAGPFGFSTDELEQGLRQTLQ